MTAPFDVAAAVVDPELPMVTIAELGILRDVVERDGSIEVTITPTYSACPAMTAIAADLAAALADYGNVTVRTRLSPPWSSDWITPDGRAKLAAAGIAPPVAVGPIDVAIAARCPRCGSLRVRRTAAFGSTQCKALFRCESCDEPFEQVKTV